MADSRSIEEIPWAARLGVEWRKGVLRLKGGSKDTRVAVSRSGTRSSPPLPLDFANCWTRLVTGGCLFDVNVDLNLVTNMEWTFVSRLGKENSLNNNSYLLYIHVRNWMLVL